MNKKVLGMLKNEPMKIDYVKNEETANYEKRLKGEILVFCGLRPKLYGMRFENYYDDDIKCKGINKSTRIKTIKFNHIKEVLFSGIPQFREMERIRSIDHDLFSQRVKKNAISADDDKRHILENGISH